MLACGQTLKEAATFGLPVISAKKRTPGGVSVEERRFTKQSSTSSDS